MSYNFSVLIKQQGIYARAIPNYEKWEVDIQFFEKTIKVEIKNGGK